MSSPGPVNWVSRGCREWEVDNNEAATPPYRRQMSERASDHFGPRTAAARPGATDRSREPSYENELRHDDATAADDGDGPTVVLYTRGSAVGRDLDRERDIADALGSLAADGVVGSVEVRTWPARVSLRSGDRDGVVAAFEAIEEWAEEEGVSVRPPFDVRERRSTILREQDDLLVTPTLCLTVWDGDDVLDAYPRCESDGAPTVEEGLRRVRAAEKTPSAMPVAEPRGDR